MNRMMQLKTITRSLLITLAFLCFGLLPRVQAVVPPPDGGYPNFTTAEGQNALFSLTSGAGNTAVGWFSLFSNSEGSFNTATGVGTLLFNTADENTALGAAALLFNTTGFGNTANGAQALLNNTTGDLNTANGINALYSNSTGTSNTAAGVGALQTNTDGGFNTANGRDALYSNTYGNSNTATGGSALLNNTAGTFNTANGSFALGNNTIGNYNTALGRSAGSSVTTANNVICIGADVSGANVDNSCYIGQIFGATSSGGTSVFINSSGRLGTLTSSRRFKEKIKPMDKASEAILALKPVTFHYKKKIDPTGWLQFGLVAEDVEKVNPDLVVCDKEGRPYTVRYDQVNAMLLNEFLKEHRKVEQQQAAIRRLEGNAAKQEARISELNKNVGILITQLKEQAAQSQKASAQIEISKAVGQTALNKP